MTSHYARGKAAEHRTIALLKSWGYRTMRSAGSKGVYDVHGWVPGRTTHRPLYVQVKSGKPLQPAQVRAIVHEMVAAGPSNALLELHYWAPRASAPVIVDCWKYWAAEQGEVA